MIDKEMFKEEILDFVGKYNWAECNGGDKEKEAGKGGVVGQEVGGALHVLPSNVRWSGSYRDVAVGGAQVHLQQLHNKSLECQDGEKLKYFLMENLPGRLQCEKDDVQRMGLSVRQRID